FLDDLDQGLARLRCTDSLILMGNFNAHVGNDTETWNGVIGRNGDAHVNRSGELLLEFCASNALSIMNTYFQHKDIHKFTWYRDSLAQRSIIDFVIVSPELKRSVVDVRVKRGAELSTDHHLLVASIRCDGREPVRRRGKAVTRVRWEALQDPTAREKFANEIAAR